MPRIGRFLIHIAQFVLSSKVTGLASWEPEPELEIRPPLPPLTKGFLDSEAAEDPAEELPPLTTDPELRGGGRLFRVRVELEVDRELSDELEAEELLDELLDPDPESDPEESDPESLERDRRRDCRLLPPPPGWEANLLRPRRSRASRSPADDREAWPLSLLLLVLLQVDRGLEAAPPPRLLSLFRYKLEDLTERRSEFEADPEAEGPPPGRGDSWASFQLPDPIKLEDERPPLNRPLL